MDVNEELKFRGVGLGDVRVVGGQGGCEQRIEVFVKIQKKFGGLGRVGVRVDVNKELKFLGKFTKKKFEGGSGGGRFGRGVRWGRVGSVVGVRVDVNAMFGVGGIMGYGNQE